MNDLDELLQEGLTRLEAGEPLDVASAALPDETAVALNMAAQLRSLPLPEPDESAFIAQRAAIIRTAEQQAAQMRPAQNASPVGWLAPILAWWRDHRAIGWGLAAVTAVVVLLFVSGLGNRESNDPVTIVERDEAWPVQESDAGTGSVSLLDRLLGRDGVSDETPSVAADPVEDSAESETTVAEVAEDALAFQTFLPYTTSPLIVGPETAVLGDFQGVVSVLQADGRWEQVNTLSSVAAGSRVRTGALSKASLTFFDGSVAKLGPDSELSIDTLNALRPEAGFRTVVLTQWRGDSLHDVQFRNDNGSRYEVQSPSGTGIARGTTFQVTVLPDLTSRYTVLEGRVDVTNINVTVSVLSGQLSTILSSSPPSTPVFQVSGEGEVTQTGTSWIIGGQTFETDDQTIIVGNPQVGDWVRVQGHLLDDGRKVADQIVLTRALPQNRFSLMGIVTAMSATQWQLGNVVILLDEATAVDPNIAVNDRVRITGVVQADGTLLAEQIQWITATGTPFEFTGVVQTISPQSWLISGIEVLVNGRTEIKNNPLPGDVVKVEGQIDPDGSWLAHEIKLVDDDEHAAEFEFTGIVESMEPWVIAGIALATDEWTEIDTAVVLGSRVEVEGIILPDGTWLAEEITLLDEHFVDEIIIHFSGVVETIDPWVVNGFALIQTDESRLAEGLVVGSLVQVSARLAADGTWEILWIRPLLPPTVGCFTVHTRIATVNGSQITLVNWPTVILDDHVQVEGNLVPNSIISINICLGNDDAIIVVHIIVIQIIVNNPPPPNNDNGGSSGSNRVTICHKGNTLTISQSGLNGHLGHGDSLGACGQGDHDDDDDDD